MSDLTMRLRAVDHMNIEDCFLQSPLYSQAADEIDRLEAENALLVEERDRLRKALKPFAAEASMWGGYSDEEPIVEGFPGYKGDICVSDLRAARAALEPKP